MSLQPDQDSTWRVRHVAGRPTGAASRPVVTAAGQLIDDAMRAFGVLVTAAGGHSRFGRGRGKGTARRSTTMCANQATAHPNPFSRGLHPGPPRSVLKNISGFAGSPAAAAAVPGFLAGEGCVLSTPFLARRTWMRPPSSSII